MELWISSGPYIEVNELMELEWTMNSVDREDVWWGNMDMEAI